MEVPEKWCGPARYEIKVKGLLGNKWLTWFGGVSIKPEGSLTIITAEVRDQSALHGLIIRIRDLGLPLISIKRLKRNESETANCQEDNNQSHKSHFKQ